jgi:hypothetical protein
MADVASNARRAGAVAALPPTSGKLRRGVFVAIFVVMFGAGAGIGFAHPLAGAVSARFAAPTAVPTVAPAATARPGVPAPAAAGTAATPDSSEQRLNLAINEQNYCDCNGDTPR